jgi:hypothetical protein
MSLRLPAAALCVLCLVLDLLLSVRAAESAAVVTVSNATAVDKPPRPRRIGGDGYDDPAADEVRGERARLPNGSNNFGNNVGAIYVDVTDLTSQVGPIRLDHGRAEVLDVSGMDPRKVKALGLDGARFVAATSNVSDPNSTQHSEEKLITAATDLLRTLGVRSTRSSRCCAN